MASTIPHIHTYTYTGTHAHEQGKDARIRVTIFTTKEIQRENTSLPFDHTRSRIAKSPRFGATHTPHETCRFAAEARDTVPPYPRYLFLLLPLLFHTPLSSEPPPFPRPSWWTVVSPPSCFLVTHSCPLLLLLRHITIRGQHCRILVPFLLFLTLPPSSGLPLQFLNLLPPPFSL